MASKGPRSKLDHETRARRQKALEIPKEPPRPKAHWDHVLEEMVWLSKDFEAERKWKLAQAKKVAIRASKNILDQATRGEKKVKEEEQRLRKVALNISKDVKKFWMKIEKLVHYKHQLDLEERKKKALDKQLDFLLGQTERYSTMLAENLIDKPDSLKSMHEDDKLEQGFHSSKHETKSVLADSVQYPDLFSNMEMDDDYDIQPTEELEDDEHTIEEDEAFITEEERRDELAALQDEGDLPLEELLKRYTLNKASREVSPESGEDATAPVMTRKDVTKDASNHFNGVKPDEKSLNVAELVDSERDRKMENSHADLRSNYHVNGQSNGDVSCLDELAIKTSGLQENDFGMQDNEYVPLGSDEELDDETTLAEEEEMARKEKSESLDEITLLQQESEMSIDELLARYMKDSFKDDGTAESECSSSTDERDCETPRDVCCEESASTMDDSALKLEVLVENKEQEPPMEDIETKDERIVDGREGENIIADAAAAARSAQPTGNTFSTTKVRTKFPFLLKYPLREYQHIGLDWLVTMYDKRLNGILADEMGLGKTIMTIALLAHLACEKGIWGPHLIVVPTSVMLNWETEFLKWCPAFKILTYFGSAKERKHKRQGWLKPNSFHVCITTYRLVIQDSKVFKRKKWKYLILDEAHLIKNWKSQRWQTLLNFNSKRRILLTGTPLQNDLMELWSLMHFLMPHIFQSHQEFKDWFCNPISGMVEGQEKVNKDVVDRLHNVLRPFILRRLKRDVEKQLPKKQEQVMYCRLSKRQRNLYEDFIASSETQATLASSNYFGMISVIMQLRKVCNHPDLFEGRPIISSLDMAGIDVQVSSSICTILSSGPFSEVDLKGLNFVFTQHEFSMSSWEIAEVEALSSPVNLFVENGLGLSDGGPFFYKWHDQGKRFHGSNIFEEIQITLLEERLKKAKERAAATAWWNSLQCQKKPVYGTNLRELVTIKQPVFDIHEQKNNPSCYLNFSSKLADIVLSPVERLHVMLNLIECFMFAIPAARAPPPVCWCSGRSPVILQDDFRDKCTMVISPLLTPVRPAIIRRQVYFPDRRLIQFDCGKLQELAVLLRRLKSEGHRALIFTQMTKMLDILEAFINLYGYTYMRLDGSTQPEERQTLMQRFNTNPKFFLFILSTRSGGVGINLVGADTVIFYDSDWNPAMDQQAQDRCHRIGQTREVHIYRLISECTIEENILRKANQKRLLDDLVIQSGSYNTEFFKKLDPMELFSGHRTLPIDNLNKGSSTLIEYPSSAMGSVISTADVEAAIKLAEDEADYMALKKVQEEEDVDNQEFTEEAIGRLEEDELIYEDDTRKDEKMHEDPSGCTSIGIRDGDAPLCGGSVNEENAITLAGSTDDIDMLADVKQMVAAAAAAGHASSSFENQLRPIDQYAMRFLELWDPIIDKSAIEFRINVEEEEWELDRIEKFKEDLEAEIDEDQEPFLYERWDADFATTAYRQHVEALAQRQMMEELEYNSQEGTDGDTENFGVTRYVAKRKTKSKKKLKKTKFKSLKKGPLTSQSEAVHDELLTDEMPVDDMVLSPDISYSSESPSCSPPKKKRKKVISSQQHEKNSMKNLKNHKKVPVICPVIDFDSPDKQLEEIGDLMLGEGATDLDHKSASKSKMGGKITITAMPLKRVMLVKAERLKKRGHIWSKDCFPYPDPWSSQEDAVLCAVVHEYSTHWELVSDLLYTMPSGGFYRGRFRHPVHCCERFRELFLRYVLSATDSSNIDKINSSGSGKALLKVTEDHVQTLLNVTCELPDNELLLQKHFMAICASVWRAKCRLEQWKRTVPFGNGFYSSRFHSYSFVNKPRRLTEKMNLLTLGQSSELVMTALTNADYKSKEDSSILFSQEETPARMDMLDLTLDIPPVVGGDTLPSVVNVSIHDRSPPPSSDEPGGWMLREGSCSVAENRFRLASEACFEGEGPVWASSSFSINDIVRYRAGPKSQSLGKHKAASYATKPSKAKLPRIVEPDHESAALTNLMSPPSETAACADFVDWFSSSHINHDSGADFQSHMSESNVLHAYDPGFIAGLEDLGSLLDTDIG